MHDLPSLFAAAGAARARAYAPYSRFAVGAALETADGRRFTGANVENASYGLTICAERSAVFAAVHAGATEISAVAIAGPDGVAIVPCGACRQVLAEFSPPGTPVVYGAGDGTTIETTIGALLPAAFDAGALAAAIRGEA
jgi:homotetrameric cytidine deaminase